MNDRKDLKALIYQVAAATDRGQRMNAMIAPMYKNKLEEMLSRLADEIDKMPRVFGWAVNQIGVESAFKDCDANEDGVITLEEMRKTSTCLDSCFKLSIVNFAL